MFPLNNIAITASGEVLYNFDDILGGYLGKIGSVFGYQTIAALIIITGPFL